MKRTFKALTLLAGLFPALVGININATEKPNIIFILADDLGYGDIEPFGQKMIKTPSLKRMAREGMRFTQHYAGAPVCAPSRSVLMTGQHTGRTPVRGNKRDIYEGVQPLAHNVMTIAEMLQAETDYTTALYGRWHLGGKFSDSQPHQRGFDEFYGPLSAYYKPANTYYRHNMNRNAVEEPLPGNNHGAQRQHREDRITDEAIQFLKRQANAEDPFFLYMAYSFPHAPIQPVPGETDYSSKVWPQKQIDFAHNVARLDSYVGRVLDQLEQLGMEENTLVIFTSDNGPHAEDGQDPDFFDSNGPFRGIKRDLYEGGIRMPFIAWWPKTIKPGTTSDHISAFQDLMPTVADLAGAPYPKQSNGISYAPTLVGKTQPEHKYLYWEFKERTPQQALRKGDWKGVYFIAHDRFELYNLASDIGEQNDLAAEYPKKVAEFRRLMDEAHTYNRDFPITNAEKFIQVSPRNPRYFQYEDGTPFIPIGCSISWSRTTEDPEEALEQFREYFKAFGENGGNLIRIWLSAPLFEIERDTPFGYDFSKTLTLHDALIELATEYGIKLKFCMENFRTVDGYPPKFVGSVRFDKPIYFTKYGGPLETFEDYFTTPTGHQLYLEKLKFYSNKYGDHPSIFGWELWNEFNSVRISRDMQIEWTEHMLAETKKIFPRHLIMQTTGSYDSLDKKPFYERYHSLPNNDVAQVHRYLDLGADWFVCKSPMDILTAEAIRDFREIAPGKPVILSETGGVEPRHAGPLKLYDVDSEGVILHDGIFAPFFAGSAGSGQFWHWHHYVEKHDLWWHYGRFHNAIQGINPLRENFQPLYRETSQTRNYILKGNYTTLIWIRDVDSDWKTELADGEKAKILRHLKLPHRSLALPADIEVVDVYLPWEDRWTNASIKNGEIELPPFKRSLVIRTKRDN